MNPNVSNWRSTPLFMAVAWLLTACSGGDPQKMLESARQYLEKNDGPAAIIQLKNALQEKPDLAEARFLLGKALLANGDAAGAETELRKARDAGYPADQVVPQLVRSRLMQGQFSQVTDEFGQVKLTTPESSAELSTLLAIAWKQQGKREMYESSLREALQAKPDHASALIEQARSKASQRDFAGALTVLDELLAKQPKESDALKLRGDILMFGRGDPDAAIAAYRAALEARPKYQDAHVGVIRVQLSQGQIEQAEQEIKQLSSYAAGSPQTLYLQTQLAFKKGDLKAAQEHVQQLLKRAPDSPTALEIAGVIELQLNSVGLAEVLLAKAVQSAPELRVARRALVLAYLRSGQADRALAVLPEDIATNDGDVAMLSVAGQAHMVKGDFEQAQRFFNRAAKQDPKNPAKRTSLAVSQLMSGKTEMALSELNDIASSDTGVTADMALINAFMQRREVDKALLAIDSLEKKRAKDPMPSQLRGRALLLRGDRSGARKAFERALEIDPEYIASVAALAALDMGEKKPQDAQKRFEAFTQRNPKNVQALMALAEIRAGSGGSKEEVADLIRKAVDVAPTDKAARLLLIEHYLRNKDAKAALTAAQSAVATLPHVPDLIDAQGRAQSANGEYNQAMSNFKKLAGMIPTSPLPYLRMASVSLASKDNAAAMQSLRKALEIQPDLLDAQRALADLALQTKQPAEALAVSRTVQKQRPKAAAGYLLEGDVHAASKNWSQATEAYRNGLKVVPAPELAIKMHAALTLGGQVPEAERFATDWLKNNPKDIALLMYLGDRAISASKLADAQRHYERVIVLQPRNALALNNLAWVAGRLGRGDAIALAEKANEVTPDQPAFMDTLATLLSEKNEHARALVLQKKAVEIQPGTPIFKLNLAKIQIKAGEKEAARAQLDELSALGNKFAAQAEVQKLKQGL